MKISESSVNVRTALITYNHGLVYSWLTGASGRFIKMLAIQTVPWEK